MEDLVTIAIDEKLALRQIEKADATTIYALIENNRNYLRNYLNWIDEQYAIDDTINYIADCDSAVFHQSGMTFVILFQNEIIGSINFHTWNHRLKKVEIGYWVASQFSKKGITTHCVKSLMHYLFSNYAIEKIELHFLQENVGSARIAEKLGFRIEGILRNRYWHHGKLKNLVIAGLLKDEFTMQ